MPTRVGVALLIVACLAVPAWAQKWGKVDSSDQAPPMSIKGPTGVILTPNADVLGASRWAIGYHHEEREAGGGHDIDFDIPKLNFGIGDSIEVGAAFLLWDAPWDDGDEAIVHAKWRLLDDQENMLRFAVGIWDIFDQVETRWYVVATKGFGETRNIADLSVGYIFGDNDPEGYRQLEGDSVFASLNWHALPCLDLMGEVADDDFNYGIRWWPADRWNVDAAILDGGDWAVGAAYTGTF